MSDPELTHLREDIALIHIEIEERVKNLYSEDQEDIRRSLVNEIKACREALESHSGKVVNDAEQILGNHEITIKKSLHAENAFDRLQPLLEQRRKTVESETRRTVNKNNHLPLNKLSPLSEFSATR